MLVDRSLAIHLFRLGPELPGLHGETAGERVELLQSGCDRKEGCETVLGRIGLRPGATEAVIEIDAIRRHNPE